MARRYYWLKLKEDFFDDKVVKYLRKLPEGPSLVIIFLKMQLKSLKTEGFIHYDGILPTCEDELAMVLDEDPMLVKGAVNALVNMGVVERWDNDMLYMAAMQPLIGTETQAAERVRKHRALKKANDSPPELPGNDNALHCNAAVTGCNTEKEREKDKEKEKREREDSSSEGVPPSPAPPAPSSHIPYEQIKDLYNSLCPSLQKCTKLTETRKKALKARFSSGYTLDDFKHLFEKAGASRFLKGGNKNNWRADFEWLIQDDNMAKVLEGKYDDHQEGGNDNGGNRNGSQPIRRTGTYL